MKDRRKGFTLIELMMVVAIMGILAAIAVVGFSKYREEAAKEEAKSFLNVVKLKQEAYSSRFGRYVDASTAPTTAPIIGTKLAWPTTGTESFQALGAVPRTPLVGWQYQINRFADGAAGCNVATNGCCGGINAGEAFSLEARRRYEDGTVETLCTNSGRDGVWQSTGL